MESARRGLPECRDRRQDTVCTGDIRSIEGRFTPENLPHNLALVELLKNWAEQKQARPGQTPLAWLLAQKPWIVPIPGTTQMAHIIENIGAPKIKFSPTEIAELNTSVGAIEVQGARLPDPVQACSNVEAPAKS